MGFAPWDRDLAAGEHAAASGGDFARLSMVSLAVSCLFAGGVFWMKQAPDATSEPSPPAPIQVELLAALTPTPAVAAPAETPARPPTRTAEVGDTRGARERPEPSRPLADEPEPAPRIGEPSEAPAATERFAAIDRPAAAAPAPAPPKLALDSVTDRFRRAVSERLARVRRYPPDARKQGAAGAAVVRFVIGRDGAVSGVSLVASAGHAVLDREALATIGRAQPLPRIPESLPAPMTLTVPINFSLR